jgi:hypothetical protein
LRLGIPQTDGGDGWANWFRQWSESVICINDR